MLQTSSEYFLVQASNASNSFSQNTQQYTPNRILWTEYSPLSYSHWKLINCSHSLDRKILFKLLNFVFQRSRFSGESICWRIWWRVDRGSGEEESAGEESSSLSASFESSYSVENFWKLKISNRNFRLKALSSFFRSEREKVCLKIGKCNVNNNGTLRINFKLPSALWLGPMNYESKYFIYNTQTWFRSVKDKRRSRLKSSRHRWITREILSEILPENSSLA